MVNKDEIKNLASLARIEITDSEALSLSKELDSILDYVGQIQKAASDESVSVPVLKNVLRDDVPNNSDNQYTEEILANAPDRDGRFLRVKKIL